MTHKTSSHQFPPVPELPSQNQFPPVPYYIGGTGLGTTFGLTGEQGELFIREPAAKQRTRRRLQSKYQRHLAQVAAVLRAFEPHKDEGKREDDGK